MKFLEVAKEGNKIRKSTWNKGIYLRIKNNLVYHHSGGIIELTTDLNTDDWEIYDDRIKVSELQYGEKCKFEFNGNVYIRVNLDDYMKSHLGDQKCYVLCESNNVVYNVSRDTLVTQYEEK